MTSRLHAVIESVKKAFRSLGAHERDFLGHRNLQNEWRIPLFLTISVHLLIFVAAFSASSLIKKKPLMPEVYTVNLYKAPELEPKAPAQQKIKITPDNTKKSVAPEPRKTEPAPEKTVSLKPVKIKKKPEENKKRKINEEVLSHRLEKLKSRIEEKKAKQEANNAATEAVSKLAEFYRSDKKKKQTDKALDEKLPEFTGQENKSGVKPHELEALQRYKARLINHIHQYWKLPDIHEWDEKLEAVIIVKVRNDGSVIDTYFEKRSDDYLFDQYVLKSIKEAEPLPPFPLEINKPVEELVIRFFPGGLS